MKRSDPPPHAQPSRSPGAAAGDQRPAAIAPNVRRLSSTQLFAGCAEVQIEHGPALYRLKQTSLGKLILIK